MVQKLPPPPPIANVDPAFNRWLVEILGILSNAGGIDGNQIAGYSTLQSTVTTQGTQIASLQTTVNSHTTSINSLNTAVSSNTAAISSLNSSVTALQARSSVLNGTTAPGTGTGANGDWYADTTAKHIYVKVAGAWVLII